MWYKNKYLSNIPLFIFAIYLSILGVAPLGAAPLSAPGASSRNYGLSEIVESGNGFFGETTGSLAKIFEKIFASYGAPDAYVLGQEGSGAFIGGLTYGEGLAYTKRGPQQKVYWQGPTLGWDFGGQGSRLMILIYHLDNIKNLWHRYVGLSGSAYFVAGAGFNIMRSGDVILIPVRTGVGARLGINLGYLKVTPAPTWNPF